MIATPELNGLGEEEARRRLERRGPLPEPASSRSYASIVRANVLTLPNLILFAFGVATLSLGELADALFIGIVVVNSVIGSVQEIRAKRSLERLAALVRPEARVVRDGNTRSVHVGELVEGDLVNLLTGDQVVADGVLTRTDGLLVDESILTGESEPIARTVGDELRSGSFAAEGSGHYTVTAVGPESYAERLAGEARAFRHPLSPFQRGLNRLVVSLVVLGVPLTAALVLSVVLRDLPLDEALPTVVAGAVNLIPEGLILLTSVVYVTGAFRLSGQGILTQQLNAIESLASADVVCFDKTGTLTETSLRVADLVPAPGHGRAELEAGLGRLAASSGTPTPTLDAIAEAFPTPAEEPLVQIPFSSRWKWSAVRLEEGSYVLGAPELFPLGDLADRARAEAEGGRRVLAFAVTGQPLEAIDPAQGAMPTDLETLGLVLVAERLRPDARETVEYFHREDVELLVLSGDAPGTVGAIAGDAGIATSEGPVDGGQLPNAPEELRQLLRDRSVVGRISPEGKRRVVSALAEGDRYVAMVGDGVNDVPALKASRIAIAQGSGSQMARTISDLVLVEGSFGAVPRAVSEGRQILRNMQRVSKLYATKCLLAALIILFLGLAPIDYPFKPRHLSLVSFFVTGVPPTLLALAPSSGPWRMRSYLRDVTRFAVPASFALALGIAVSYVAALVGLDLGVIEARTVSTTVFVVAFLYLVFVLEATSPRRALWVGAMIFVLLALLGVVLAVPFAQEFFQLVAPDGELLGMIALGVAVAVGALTLFDIRPAVTRRSATDT